MRILNRRKRTVDWIVEKHYTEGFLSGVYGCPSSCLEYSSTSGLYEFNPIRSMAYDAGRAEAIRVLAERNRGTGFSLAPRVIEAPGRVYAEAYGMARIAASR